MPALFDLIEQEPEPGVRAVLGHWLFGYIHPYPDGNGRMARFMMNAMLASGGYPWTVIRVEDRDVFERPRQRQYRFKYPAVCPLHRRAGAMVSGRCGNPAPSNAKA